MTVSLETSMGGYGKRDLGKRTTTFIVVCFRDALDGPRISWVPPHYSPSPVPSSSENGMSRPHPSGKGEGRMQWVRVLNE